MTLRRRSPRPIESALAPLRDAWAPETVLAEAQRTWPNAVGSAIAGEARPVAERAGVLTIACSGSVWAQELDLMAATILERLNQGIRTGRVTKLRCIVGS